jgi:hypothetical protein
LSRALGKWGELRKDMQWSLQRLEILSVCSGMAISLLLPRAEEKKEKYRKKIRSGICIQWPKNQRERRKRAGKKTHVSRNLQINPHPHCWALAHIPVHTKNAAK